MMLETNKLGYNGPYLERGGLKTAEMAEVLSKPPEFPLSSEERELAYGFENQLFDHVAANDKSIGDVIREHKGENISAPLFFAEAFMEARIPGVELPAFDSPTGVYEWVATAIQEGTVSPNDLRKMAKKSGELYREKMAESLVAGHAIDPSWLEVRSLVVDPEHFIETATGLGHGREYLMQLRKEYQAGDNLEGAKRAIIDVYLARVNSALAGSIPMADYLSQQAALVSDDSLNQAARQLIPEGLRHALEDATRRGDVFRRLDFLRNGMGLDEKGSASRVAYDVEKAVDEMSETDGSARFSPEQIQILKETMIDPAQIKEIMSSILRSAGMLSGEPPQTWSPERSHRAGDELFQVVENPYAPSFAVDGKSGAYMVPSVPYSLYNIVTVAGFHELTHINQAEADKALGKRIRLASLRGKRVSMLREGGANAEQRANEKEWFGTAKPNALTYAKALQALEAGGGIAEASEAFYQEKRRIMPDLSPITAAKEAADRVMRLVRQGGIDSAAMSYAEGGLFIAELEKVPRNVRHAATAVTSFDIVDQIKLHKYGLLAEGETDTIIDWTPHIEKILTPYIEQALAH